MVSSRNHIAAIGYTLDDAKRVAHQYNIPDINAVSVKSVLEGGHRGRSFAGYILQPGFLPPTKFWQSFTPCLVGAGPRFSVMALERMLAEAVKREDEQAKLFHKIEETL